MAESAGWLAGPRDRIVRGRMPAKLVAEAKKRSGITSDSKLIEAALAKIAAVDDYWLWLIANRGTIDPDIDLEF
jgi:hypothetical protein